MTPRTDLAALLTDLARDIGLVHSVAGRRSDHDADHRQMLARLDQWQQRVFAVAAALREREPADLVALVQEWRDTTRVLRAADDIATLDMIRAQSQATHALLAWTPAAAPPPAETGGE